MEELVSMSREECSLLPNHCETVEPDTIYQTVRKKMIVEEPVLVPSDEMVVIRKIASKLKTRDELDLFWPMVIEAPRMNLQIQSLLGSGGNGVVVLAKNLATEELVVVKSFVSHGGDKKGNHHPR